MNKKQNPFEKIGNFIAGKGFYLVVLVCVAAIALSGFYLFRNAGGTLDQPDDQPVGGSASIPVDNPSPSPSSVVEDTLTPSLIPGTPSPAPKESEKVTPSPAPAASPSPSASAAPSPSPAVLVFTWPVNGTVISGYSVEALAYDVTMGDWRTHAGIDIAAAIGTQVMATAAGTVSAVFEDDLLGTTIIIDHGNGLESLYANLTTVPAVKAGSKVSTGTVIGAVGRTASAESRQEPHLHFSILKNNEAVDPTNYLPKR